MGMSLIRVAEEDLSLVLESLLALLLNRIHCLVVLDVIRLELPHADETAGLQALIIMASSSPHSSVVNTTYSGRSELSGGLLLGGSQ